MFFRRFHTPELAIYSYMVGDGRRAVVIDPTRDIAAYIQTARTERLEIVAILETHVHADFVSGAKDLKSALRGTPLIYASKMGGEAWTPRYADRLATDGEEIHLGSLKLHALHTPGHTPEHLIWLCYDLTRSQEVPWFCFTGDLLFVGGVGRPDLLGEEAFKQLSQQLYQSLFEKLAPFPDFVEIYPAHGAGSLCGKSMSDRTTSTLGYERRFNPSLHPLPMNAWVEELAHKMPAAPLHFQSIKRINVEGPSPLSQEPLRELNSDEIKNGFILDVRDPLKFSESHLAGAVNIPFSASFCNWVSMYVPENKKLILVVPEAALAMHLEKLLHLIGYQPAGYVIWDKVVQEPTLQKEKMVLITPQELATSQYCVIDIRTPEEWNSGHINEAQHIEMAKIPNALQQLPPNKPLALICGSGYRSTVTASWLKTAGRSDVSNVWGGMRGWHQAGFPTVSQED